ncbi:SRPBCC family protein [Kineococcus sp. SYSU DK003]|uniref:SRPBCC family protein n=1 Tax=Kineococcus sp. SYSU DK003 TaxID=3383124 RepID=UPI003D7CB2A5
MDPQPTGRVERRGTRCDIVLTRNLHVPVGEVWSTLTESERTAAWIGPWTGDPASGRVALTMTAEEAGPPADVEVLECAPPTRLRLATAAGDSTWVVEFTLAEQDGATVVTFVHGDVDPAAVESVGPGWEFYLDRLAAVVAGGDPAAVDFDRDYHPAMAGYYRQE